MGHYVRIGTQIVWHESEGRAVEYASQSRPRRIDVRHGSPRWTSAGRSLEELQRYQNTIMAEIREDERRARERETARFNSAMAAQAERQRKRYEQGNGTCSALPFMASKYV